MYIDVAQYSPLMQQIMSGGEWIGSNVKFVEN